MTTFRNSMHSLEDTLVDLQALIRLGIMASENTDGHAGDFMGCSLNTLLWVLLDKVETCTKANADMFKAEYATTEGDRVQ